MGNWAWGIGHGGLGIGDGAWGIGDGAWGIFTHSATQPLTPSPPVLYGVTPARFIASRIGAR
ncbi:hypothetical protein H6F73_05445 [Microcoleus sp. FACHB-68]|nr:hypothetical protein [Microcoleus sp. FACHB-68]